MPISSIGECTENHWAEVLSIFNEAIEDAGFDANLVSNSDDVGVIHKRIIQNLYTNPIVICDVSQKNPNVMFELGLRLAFDKPTIIVKDDQTSYTFDTSAIEHIEYPRDLRFSRIVEFKSVLAEKIKATYLKSTEDKNYTTFLKHFGEFKVAKIDKKEVSGQEYIIEELKNIRISINKLESSRNIYRRKPSSFLSKNYDVDVCLGGGHTKEKPDITELVEHPSLTDVSEIAISPGHYHIVANIIDDSSPEDIKKEIRQLFRKPAILYKQSNKARRKKG